MVSTPSAERTVVEEDGWLTAPEQVALLRQALEPAGHEIEITEFHQYLRDTDHTAHCDDYIAIKCRLCDDLWDTHSIADEITTLPQPCAGPDLLDGPFVVVTGKVLSPVTLEVAPTATSYRRYSFRLRVSKRRRLSEHEWTDEGAWQRDITVHVGGGVASCRTEQWVAFLRPGMTARVRCDAADVRLDELGHLLTDVIRVREPDDVELYPRPSTLAGAARMPDAYQARYTCP